MARIRTRRDGTRYPIRSTRILYEDSPMIRSYLRDIRLATDREDLNTTISQIERDTSLTDSQREYLLNRAFEEEHELPDFNEGDMSA